jgi:hypothetical protein
MGSGHSADGAHSDPIPTEAHNAKRLAIDPEMQARCPKRG